MEKKIEWKSRQRMFFNIAAIFDLKWTSFLSRHKDHFWRTLITANYLVLKILSQWNFDKFAWIQNLFNTSSPSKFISAEEDGLIELSCNKSLKTKFSSMELAKFRNLMFNELNNK